MAALLHCSGSSYGFSPASRRPPAGGVRMGSIRQLLFWVVLAAAATALLGSVLWWERGHASARWSALPIGSPGEGAELFEKKGCVDCHASRASGGRRGRSW